MTARTIARPTIVRTSPPPAPGAAVWAVFWAVGRLSGVVSPSAASAEAGISRPQKRAGTSAGRIGRIFITEEATLDRSPSLHRRAHPRLEGGGPRRAEADTWKRPAPRAPQGRPVTTPPPRRATEGAPPPTN